MSHGPRIAISDFIFNYFSSLSSFVDSSCLLLFGGLSYKYLLTQNKCICVRCMINNQTINIIHDLGDCYQHVVGKTNWNAVHDRPPKNK